MTISQETEINRRKNGLNSRSISQWPLASQLTGGHNKMGNADHIAKKFVANILYVIGSLCSKFGDSLFSKQLQQKDQWTQVRGPEHSR